MATQEIPKVKIVIDASETRSGMPALLRQLKNVDVEVETQRLDCGDYLLADDCAVERKSGPDLIASILDGRFIPQMQILAAQYPKGAVVIEGDPRTNQSLLTDEALFGAISYVSMLKGLSVISTKNVKETALLLGTMARQLQVGIIPPTLRSKKPKDVSVLQRYLVEGLHGIGPALAIKLLEEFGSPANVFALTEAEWRKIPGIGPGKAAQIAGAIHTSGLTFDKF